MMLSLSFCFTDPAESVVVDCKSKTCCRRVKQGSSFIVLQRNHGGLILFSDFYILFDSYFCFCNNLNFFTFSCTSPLRNQTASTSTF
ncbi:unnamed protein product [Amoebophrya sp. A120]|nr:unnamed protein product [Amoebophrya sp. A120]|eukprot:GSA120T00013236001.1